ncbi:MAG: GNAT family N-acetyltransferase [Acidimicrobiales bacterium]
MPVERTNDPVVALEWSFDRLGAANPVAFLLAPESFAFLERTPDSLALTLDGEPRFGAAFGPRPPWRPEWGVCFVDRSTLGPRVGALVEADHWDFYTRPVGEDEHPRAVDEITDDAAVTELLTRDAPHSAVWPGNPEVVAWYGLRDDAGLASVAALVRWRSGYHVLASMATRADARGRGLARRVVAGVVGAASARRVPWLGLGVDHANDVAQHLYVATGFTRRALYTVYRSPGGGAGHR